MSLVFKTNFYKDDRSRKELIRFVNQIHNLDLTRWDQLGYWDKNYRPFSFFDGSRMVANACLYSMKMRVDGQDCQVAQISGVGVDPAYRQRGLAYELNMKAIEWAENKHDFYFLFADSEAFRLYEKCGFRRDEEHRPVVNVGGSVPTGRIRKLNMNAPDDRDLVYAGAINRTPVSNLWGVNNPKLLMFWALYFLSDNIYYIDELDLVIMFSRNGERTTVYDIVGAAIPGFETIYPFISAPTDRQVEFMFMTDRLGIVQGDWVTLGPEAGMHLRGDCPVENGPFIIPMTARA